MYAVFPSAKYKRLLKLAQKRGLDMDLLDWCIDQLLQDIPLPVNWNDHQLKGNLVLSKSYLGNIVARRYLSPSRHMWYNKGKL